eukprot:TRINITY_DN20839_c0_g1_i2.p1 TRINITY_DN20839_c0_g1~~TRINITY_DN20839_c0_g1_i2.p1  ORF type:complete len:502 (-),score=93.22 TRINITY_DN20839_c0_g1_i2:45-1442(-)
MSFPIWTSRGDFTKLMKGNVFVNDDEQLKSIFEEKVMFVHPAVSQFRQTWDAIGVPLLSSKVKTSILQSSKTNCLADPSTRNFYCVLLKKLIAIFRGMLSSKQLKSVNQELTHLKVFFCPHLVMEHQLTSFPECGRVLEYQLEKPFWFDLQSCTLFISTDVCEFGIPGFSCRVVEKLFPFVDVAPLMEVCNYQFVEGCRQTAMLVKDQSDPDWKCSLDSVPTSEGRGQKRKSEIPSLLANNKRFKLEIDALLGETEAIISQVKEQALKVSFDNIRFQSVPVIGANSNDGDMLGDDELRKIGNMAEFCVYQMLCDWVLKRSGGKVKLSTSNWVSSAKARFFPENSRSVDDSLGYDLYFEDDQGLIPSLGHMYGEAPRGVKVTWMFEVKGHLSGHRNRCFVSSNEWEIAGRSTRSVTSVYRYVIVGVALRPTPRLLYWLEDPHEMERRRMLQVQPKDLIVSNFPMFQ